VTAFSVTRQLLFNGAVTGLVIGLLAMGIVLIHRSTQVLNFAVGNIGLVGASLLALMTVNYQFPYWGALLLALAAGTVFGAAVELLVIRRLFDAPRVVVLVATVGIALVAQGVVGAYPDIDARGSYPVAIGGHWDVGGLRITGAQLSIVVVAPLLALGLGGLVTRTTFGKAVTASADNRPLARLSGINPKLVSTFVWTVAAFFSTVAIILLSGQTAGVTGLAAIGLPTLARALVAALIAGMRSFPRAMVAGVLIGVVEAAVRFNALRSPGVIDVLLVAVALVAAAVLRQDDRSQEMFVVRALARPTPPGLHGVWWVRNFDTLAMAAAVVLAVVVPIVVTTPSRVLLYATILCFAICASSLTVVTGWAGQVSLAQMTFAGLGALLAAALSRGLRMDVWLLDFQVTALPFVLSIPIAAVLVAAVAAFVGAGALRLPGLLLAVVTLVFGIAAQSYLYQRPLLSAGNPSSVPFRRGDLFGLDLASQRTYYYLCLAVLLVVLGVLARLRRRGVGRRTIAVRDNASAAAAYTVSPPATKLAAFTFAGAVAALGGALVAGLVQQVPFADRFYLVDDSLVLVGMIVIGGTTSTIGPVLGALWIVGLPAFFPGNDTVPLLSSGVGLLIVVLYLRGGLAQLGAVVRNALLDWESRRRTAAAPAPSVAGRPAPAVVTVPRTSPDAGVVLRTERLQVRFGGIFAVNDASIEVAANEIVGLIGANGAGKSTLVNAVGGFTPSRGAVTLLGDEISRLSAARRARSGLGRTFQAATLFPSLTVRETIQVALEARGHTSFLATALALPGSRRVERRQRREAEELIAFLGLGRYADAQVTTLSTGTRRVVEFAGLLALDARVMCLDEPTAGIAQREAEAFGPLIVRIQRELGASVLLIEHDMPLVMSTCDRVYCLEAGRVIASGTPAEVRGDPAVIASYLGTDERAIVRSGAAVDLPPIAQPT
jgi:ABC-type branched-subunit amino acid transport system ATPase component/ABC-type branched-subunit amino acid transport system permease subunit